MKLPRDLRFARLSTYGRHTCGLTLTAKAYCRDYYGWGGLGSGSSATRNATPMEVATNLTSVPVPNGSTLDSSDVGQALFGTMMARMPRKSPDTT